MNFQDEELKELLNIFKNESDEFIRNIYDALNSLKNNHSDKNIISDLLRDVHSLKSLLGAVKFTKIQNFVHNIEDILIIAKNNEIEISDVFINLLHYMFNFVEKNIKSSVLVENENVDNAELKNLTALFENIENNKSIPEGYSENIILSEQKCCEQNCSNMTINELFKLLDKIVQDTADACGKKVELIFLKTDKPVDIKLINHLKNTFINIIKNAVYHGIETSEKRIASGKSPVGKIQININNVNDKILIEISDDGQGFNIQKIKDTAIKKALFTEDEIKSLSNDELINLTFLSDFSTSDETTVISGRGIGMKIIQNEIAQLNGSVKISTKPNNGAKFQIEIPKLS